MASLFSLISEGGNDNEKRKKQKKEEKIIMETHSCLAQFIALALPSLKLFSFLLLSVFHEPPLTRRCCCDDDNVVKVGCYRGERERRVHFDILKFHIKLFSKNPSLLGLDRALLLLSFSFGRWNESTEAFLRSLGNLKHLLCPSLLPPWSSSSSSFSWSSTTVREVRGGSISPSSAQLTLRVTAAVC